MNERVRELAKGAGIICVVPTEGTLEYAGKGDIEHLEKFAELIIRECIGQVEQAIPVTDCAASGAYQTAKRAAISRVKDHFGVENE